MSKDDVKITHIVIAIVLVIIYISSLSNLREAKKEALDARISASKYQEEASMLMDDLKEAEQKIESYEKTIEELIDEINE